MARKWTVFLSRIQSFLAIHRKSWLIKYILIFTFAWGLTLLPSLLPNFGLAIFRFKTPAIAQSLVAQPPANSGSTLSQQAQQLYEQGDLETAVSKLKQAIEQFGVSGDTLQQTQAWSNLSLIHQARTDWRQAKIAIANSIQLAQLSSTRTPSWLSVQAQALETQAKLNISLGQFELATQAWNQATQYYSQAKNEPGAVRTQLGHSLTLQEMGLHREALKQLLKLSQNRPAVLTTDPSLQATCLRSLGNAVRIVGFVEIQEAGQFKTLTVSELGQHCGVTLSDSAGSKVDYLDQATDLLQKAIALAPSSQTRAEIALLLGHTAQDKLRRLQDAYERQPATFPKKMLEQLKVTLQAYDQAAQSSVYLTEAQAKVNKLSLSITFDRWLQLQETQLQQQAPEFVDQSISEAIADLRQDLKQPLINQQAQLPNLIDQLNGLSPSHIAFYSRLHLAHSLLPAPNSQTRVEPITIPQEQILALLQNTLAQARELGDRRSEAFAEGYLGQFAESQSQWFSAQGYTQSAVAIAEEIIAPDIAYQWHWQLGRLLKQRAQIPLAIKEYEMAIANLDHVRNNQISLKNADIQFSFRDQVEPVYRQLIELLLPPLDGVIAPDQSQLEKARKTLESLQLAELENYLRCTLQPANPKQLDSLSDQNSAAILYPIILPKQVVVIAKLPGLEKLVYFAKPISESEVRTKLTQLRYILEQDLFDSIAQEPAKTVYKWLIQPLEASERGALLKNTKTKTLVFVSDGQFRNIPVAALKDPITDQYLIEKYAVTLHLNLELKNPQPLYQHPLVTLAAGITKELGGPKQAEVELTLLQEKFSAMKLSDGEFTLKNLREQINSRPYTIVHIASHGNFTSQPETTGIESATGLINLSEIKESFEIQSQARPEPIELLVLSACRTADGDRRAILGLAGIAVQSGARSTLASLWYVDDESTSDLMQRFYAALKEKSNSRLSKAELLQSVQKQLIEDPNYSAPLYWAPFVLLGNWL